MAASPHVLVVDDSHVDCLRTSGILFVCNIRVTSMGSAEEALNFLAEENYVDLILTDYRMLYGMLSGYDLLGVVKASPELKHIPVVMVFLDEMWEEIEMCLMAGAEGYVFKPIHVIDVPLIMSYI